ncbi:MAG: CopG family transcriptional regulator [Gammaproteobacteria bacterium]|nr:CopG family transcriptional regulator [Gammaproteobacteria bacterium]
MITLRLDPELEKSINNIAHQMGISKSELIRKSIAEFLNDTVQYNVDYGVICLDFKRKLSYPFRIPLKP